MAQKHSKTIATGGRRTRGVRVHRSAIKEKQSRQNYVEGIQAVDELRWKDAERLFNAVLEFDPSHADAMVQLAFLAARRRQSIRALRLSKRALVASQKNVSQTRREPRWWFEKGTRPYLRSLRAHGLVLFQLGRLREAIASFQEVLRLDPHDHLGVGYFLEAIARGKRWRDMEASR